LELAGENYKDTHKTFKEFLANRLIAADARDEADAEFAPVKFKMTHLLKYTGTGNRNNMSNIYGTMCDFMSTEGWDLKSVTGINGAADMGILSCQRCSADE